MKSKKYKLITNHYSNSFKKFGFTYKALNWNNLVLNNLRFKIASQYIERNKSILDFGCGMSLFYKFLKKNFYVKYSGVDTDSSVIKFCKKKYKQNSYYNIDIIENRKFNKKYDFVFANGIFTQKRNLTNKYMYQYTFFLIKRLFKITKKKLFFNILVDTVDWKNSKNFYVSLDKISKFIKKNLSKKFIIRHDYNNYECMIIIFKD